MPKLLKALAIAGLALFLIGSAFAFYTYFLIDYSLESLETALAVSESPHESLAVDHIYQNIVDDLVLNEVAAPNLDYKNLVTGEIASRSLDETLDRNGSKRAKIYLDNLIQRKKTRQPVIMQVRSFIMEKIGRFFKFTRSFFRFFQKKISVTAGEKDAAFEGARFVFLSKTQKMEKQGKLKEAIDRYRQYLKRYPGSSDRGFVSISLSNALIRDGRLRESERILKDVQNSFSGKIESRIAGQMLAKVSGFDKKTALVNDLLRQRTSGTKDPRMVEYELAAVYISLYRFSEAETLLKKISEQRDLVGLKSEFKLGWLYKNSKRTKEAEKIYLALLNSKDLTSDLELGIHSELADIYYQKNDSEKALEHYRKVTEKAGADTDEGAARLWKTLSAFEQASIYGFDLNDKKKAVEQLRLIGTEFQFTGDDGINEDFFNVEGADLRAQGFRALGARQLGAAYEFFSRYLEKNAEDAWTLAGLATVSLLLGEFREASEYAKRGVGSKPDEYTSSMMGYIYGVKQEYTQAEAFYEKAMQMNPNYLPARFNLSCMKIRLKKYGPALDLLKRLEGLNGLSAIMQAKIYNNLGYLNWQLGKRAAALEQFQKAAAVEPNYLIAVKNIEKIKKRNPELAHAKPLAAQKI